MSIVRSVLAEKSADPLGRFGLMVNDVVDEAYMRGEDGRGTQPSLRSALELTEAIAAALQEHRDFRLSIEECRTLDDFLAVQMTSLLLEL